MSYEAHILDNVGFSHHDHRHCVTDAVAEMVRYCAAHQLQFTPVRKRVFELLLSEHRALGAYEILDTLRAEGLGAQPPVAYRALDFLVKHGAVHKLEKLNAFVACAHPCTDHAPAFMICRGCDLVAEAEVHPSKGALGKATAQAGFAVERVVMEFEGLCPNCQTAAAP